MNLEEITFDILENHSLCDYCLGRQFSNLATGTTNLERGQTIKSFLAMKFTSSDLESNIAALQILSKSGSDLARNFLEKKGILPEETIDCYICENLLLKIESLTEVILEKIKDFEVRTFLIGTLLPQEYLEREKELKEKYGILQSEYLKQEFNRNVGKKLAEKTHLNTDFQTPEIVIETNPVSLSVHLKISSLFVYGKYKKYVRTIPQTRWPCRKCKGKGCKECNHTGKRYDVSVEELIEHEALRATKGEKGVLHGAGREDIDARMLGSGRSFVLEIVNPKVRSINLVELEKLTNLHAKEQIEVQNYRFSSKNEVVFLKKSAKESIKKYRALIEFDSHITDKDLEKIESQFSEVILKQRTPKRVSHRRADKIRSKKVYSVKSKIENESEIESIIVCDGGCYVKELVSGDEGRTSPSIADTVGIKAFCKELDVLEIEEKAYSKEK
jgi:tRNA pseudouridine synthase 10